MGFYDLRYYSFMNIQNKTFLVTGAGGGIGKEMVALLLRNDAQVIAVDINDQALSSLMNSLSEHSGNNNKIKSYACDVSSKTDVDKLAQDVLTSNDGWQIDGLINCAGIIQPFLKINDLSDEAIKRVMDVNFFGVVYMTRAFLPQLLKRPEAHIVNYSTKVSFYKI